MLGFEQQGSQGFKNMLPHAIGWTTPLWSLTQIPSILTFTTSASVSSCVTKKTELPKHLKQVGTIRASPFRQWHSWHFGGELVNATRSPRTLKNFLVCIWNLKIVAFFFFLSVHWLFSIQKVKTVFPHSTVDFIQQEQVDSSAHHMQVILYMHCPILLRAYMIV